MKPKAKRQSLKVPGLGFSLGNLEVIFDALLLPL